MEDTKAAELIGEFADMFGLNCDTVYIDTNTSTDPPVEPTRIRMESLVDAPLTYHNHIPRKSLPPLKSIPRKQTTPKVIRQLAHSRTNN